jgi:ribonuclease Z
MHRAFELTVLGTSSASPTKYRNPSGQFLRMEGDYFLLDCGEATQFQLVRLGLRMHRIRYILISHLHGDHFYGLPGLMTSMALFGRSEKLTVCGPAGLREWLEQTFAISDARIPYEIEYIVSNPKEPAILLSTENWEISTVPLQHRIVCTGFIIRENGPERKINVDACKEYKVPITVFEDLKRGANFESPEGETIANELLTLPGIANRSYAYISDSIFDPKVADWVRGVNLLYHESTFLHELLDRAVETFHTTARQAGEIAALAGAEKLLIGHFSARYPNTDALYAEAHSVFNNTEVAEEGKTYLV